MNGSLKQIIDEAFKSKKQQRYFFAKANDKSLTKKERMKWKKRAEEYSSKTNFKKIPETSEQDVDEVVDSEGNIQTGDMTNDFKVKGITTPKTSDEYAKAVGGQMGGAGLDGGGNAARLMRYFGEEDMSKALGADETIEKDLPYDKAKEYFEDELEIPEDETEKRLKELGYESDYGEGVLRLVENPKDYVKEYLESILSKKTKMDDMVEKNDEEKTINPIIKKQIDVLKQTLKDNGISTKQFLSYIKNNE